MPYFLMHAIANEIEYDYRYDYILSSVDRDAHMTFNLIVMDRRRHMVLTQLGSTDAFVGPISPPGSD